MQLDKETAELLRKGSKTREFVRSEEWGRIKRELTDKLVSLADITSLTEEDPLKLMQEIKVRRLAINLVFGWVREIEGQANQYEANGEEFRKVKEETVIIQF